MSNARQPRSHPAPNLYPEQPKKLMELADVQAPVPADGDALTWVDADGRWEPVAGVSLPIATSDVTGLDAALATIPSLPIAESDVTNLVTDLAAKLPKAGGTMTGHIVATTAASAIVAKGSVSGAQSVDLSAVQGVTATATGAITWTFSSPPSGCFGFVMKLTNGGAGAQTWPAAVKWPSGTAPTLQAAGVDILGFVTMDSGTTWYGIKACLAAA